MKRILTFLTIAACVAGASTVWSQEEKALVPEPAWTGNLGLSYLATSGNTDTSSFGLDFLMERTPDPWGVAFTASFNRADDSGMTTSERYFVGARANRSLNDRWLLFGGLSGEKDEFAGFELRTIVNAGATYKALTGPRHLLDLDGGVTYTDEDRIDPDPDASWLGALLGLRYEWKISENASLTEVLALYPNFDESSDWRFNSETALQASISKRLALKLSYEIRYRNQPLEGRDDTDTTAKASVVFNL